MAITLRNKILNIVRNKFDLKYVKDDSSLIHAMERVAVIAFIKKMEDSPELEIIRRGLILLEDPGFISKTEPL